MCGEKAAPLCPALRPTRITPACAGKRSDQRFCAPHGWDHPRVCGEKFENLMGQNDKTGSPPRVRGKVLVTKNFLVFVGITPACAGKSPIAGFLLIMQRDHPRVCGEKCKGCLLGVGGLGSPPRVRGKEFYKCRGCGQVGITPACAGKSCTLQPRNCATWDHPRVCGEKVRGYVKIWNEWGSPPRVRGKVTKRRYADCACGITPACAGKSRTELCGKTGKKDHPRVCGEKAKHSSEMKKPSGSPPRVRGKAEQNCVGKLERRIPPACAGKRHCHPLHHPGRWDPPRVCGEKTKKIP